VTYPEKKRDRWHVTDAKLIKKYNMDQSKHQRYRRKASGKANFYFLRWENTAVILHTCGEHEEYDPGDTFYDIRLHSMEIPLGLTYKLHYGGKQQMTVHIAKADYKGIKAVIGDAMRRRAKEQMLLEFDKLNGIPAWGGVIEQKIRLKDYILSNAQKQGISITSKDLRVKTNRKPYSVFGDEDNKNF